MYTCVKARRCRAHDAAGGLGGGAGCGGVRRRHSELTIDSDYLNTVATSTCSGVAERLVAAPGVDVNMNPKP